MITCPLFNMWNGSRNVATVVLVALPPKLAALPVPSLATLYSAVPICEK